MSDAGAEQAEAGQAILLFEFLQRIRQIVLLTSQLGDSFVARPHDLADFVIEDEFSVDHFVLAIVLLCSLVSFEHQRQWLIDILRHDDEFENHYGEQIDSAEDQKQPGARLPRNGMISNSGGTLMRR